MRQGPLNVHVNYSSEASIWDIDADDRQRLVCNAYFSGITTPVLVRYQNAIAGNACTVLLSHKLQLHA